MYRSSKFVDIICEGPLILVLTDEYVMSIVVGDFLHLRKGQSCLEVEYLFFPLPSQVIPLISNGYWTPLHMKERLSFYVNT